MDKAKKEKLQEFQEKLDADIKKVEAEQKEAEKQLEGLAEKKEALLKSVEQAFLGQIRDLEKTISSGKEIVLSKDDRKKYMILMMYNSIDFGVMHLCLEYYLKDYTRKDIGEFLEDLFERLSARSKVVLLSKLGVNDDGISAYKHLNKLRNDIAHARNIGEKELGDKPLLKTIQGCHKLQKQIYDAYQKMYHANAPYKMRSIQEVMQLYKEDKKEEKGKKK